jgi:hypothetical protein
MSTFINAKSKAYLRKFKFNEKNERIIKKKIEKNLTTPNPIYYFTARSKTTIR